jgi:hypothetical protein
MVKKATKPRPKKYDPVLNIKGTLDEVLKVSVASAKKPVKK